MRGGWRFCTLLWVLCICALRNGLVEGQISKPIAHDDNMKEETETNKFLKREASDDSLPLARLDEEKLSNTQCSQQLELRWQTEVSSSIYATPVISDINGDGKLEVVVASFVHYLEILDGADGEKIEGWPGFHKLTVHASPIVYDIDKDGSKEIAVAAFSGEVLFFRTSGYLSGDRFTVPRLSVKKNWYVGLDPDHVDRSHPDVGDAEREPIVFTNFPSIHEGTKNEEKLPSKNEEKVFSDTTGGGKIISNTTGGDEVNSNVSTAAHPDSSAGAGTINETAAVNSSETQVSGNETNFVPHLDNSSSVTSLEHKPVDETIKHEDVLLVSGIDALSKMTGDTDTTKRRLLQAADTVADAQSTEQKEKPAENDAAEGKVITAENDQAELDDEAAASFDVFRDEDENDDDGLTEEYNYDYDDYVNEDMWGDEEFVEPEHAKVEELIQVDSHILCTPVIADIDGDGVDEMVVAVSYFFDREYYEEPEHEKELGDVDISKYVAGGIVVFNLATKQLKWNVHLDLSTDSVAHRAFIYAAPTVADLDKDGKLEIIVGTSAGFLYVLHHNGTVKENFPLQMGEIQGQVVVADINDDGRLEIVSADTKGNVAAWTGEGKELWERHLKSLISQGPTVGDVDGDGHTDLVIPTTSGYLYVLKGSDGSNVGSFPFRTHGRVMAPALLVDLSRRNSEQKGLSIAITSFDGYLYVIDGPTACADVVDIGETSYSMVLADNVDGGDDLDLIVSTMNGNVFCFQTPAPYHPLKAWSSQTQGRNVFASRHQREGVYVLPTSRMYRDEAGKSFFVNYEIVDKYVVPSGSQAPYNVSVTLMVPGNYRSSRRFQKNVTESLPGVYTVKMDAVLVRTSGTVLVEMVDKNGLYFSDEFALTFHMQYYRLLKWLVALPLLGMTVVLLTFGPQDGAHLPSFSSTRHQL